MSNCLFCKIIAREIPASIVYEDDFGQDEAIEKLIEDATELSLVAFRRDLQGIARTAIVRRHRIGRHA
jgi:diadenosine tetraphosphate (Ap4A) HIT family hydrolase